VITIRYKTFYRSNIAVAKCLLEAGRKHTIPRHKNVLTSRPITTAKVNDIHKLLRVTHGEQWRERSDLKLYVDIKAADHGDADASCEDTDTEFNCVEDDVVIAV